MSADTATTRALLVGAAASIALHLAAALCFPLLANWGDRPDAVEIVLVTEPEEVRPGIERSRAVTVSWLGFERPTEHRAPLADTEQSALALNPAPSQPPVPAKPSPAPVAQTPPEPLPPAPTPPAEPIIAVRAEGPGAPLPEPHRAAESAPSAPAPEFEAPLPELPTLASSPAEGEAGLESDKEAAATALKQAVSVEPGKTVAAQGLDIKTRRPKWHITTRLLGQPRNPVVQVTFGRDGRVRHAAFLKADKRTLNTGDPDIDAPLIDAMYRWTASGEPLAKLPAGADAGVTLTFRIVLLGP